VVLAALAWLAAGCGSSAAPAPAAAPPASAPAGAPPAASSPAAAAATTPPQPVRLTVNWTAVSGSQSGLWMTYEAGLFQEQALDVELVNIASTSRAIQAMVAGEVQMGSLDPAATVEASLNGADLSLLLASVNRLVFSIMTQPTIRQPEELRGKTLGITRIGSSTHTAALVALQMWGLKPDEDVSLRQLQEVPAILAGMQAGQVDAGAVSPPTNARARQAGYNEMINLATQGPEYPSVAVGGPRAWIDGNQEAVRRFARAYVQGIQRFKSDKPWAIEVYRKYLKVDDPAVLDDTYNQFSSYIPLPPYVSEEGMARLLEDLAHEEPRLVGRKPSEWIDSRYVRELEQSGLFGQTGGQTR
jgi:ABC-type nitrate/sulfonate/bicarbonate transport system substrate-binding protein